MAELVPIAFTVISLTTLIVYSIINYQKMLPDKYVSNLLFIVILSAPLLSIANTVPLFADLIIYTILCVLIITYFS